MTVTQQRLPGLSQDWNERFVEMLPQIRRTIRYAIRRAPRDARDEEMADSIAHAYCGFARLVNQGKGDRAFGTTLARYAVLRVRSGRRVGGRCNVRDLTSPFARRGHGIDVLPLVEQTAGGRWEEIVVEDRHSSPADIAACRIDFKALWAHTSTHFSTAWRIHAFVA